MQGYTDIGNYLSIRFVGKGNPWKAYVKTGKHIAVRGSKT